MEDFEEMNKAEEEGHQMDKLVITEDIRSFIYETAKWTKFLSVVGFVFSAFTAMFAFGSGAFLTTLAAVEPTNPLLQLGSGFITVLFLIFALLYFYPSLLLFSYSAAAKNAVLYAEQTGLNTAMNKLKSFFKFWGILMILLISLYLIAILFSIVMRIGA